MRPKNTYTALMIASALSDFELAHRADDLVQRQVRGDVLPPRGLAAQRPVSRKHFTQITGVLGLTS
jgi:hypothetical protein